MYVTIVLKKRPLQAQTFNFVKLWADQSQATANSQRIEPWNSLWVDQSQGMANSQIRLEFRVLVLRSREENRRTQRLNKE